MTHLLDTQACVSILRGHPAALERMAAHRPSDLGVSTVTGFELYSGVEACRFPGRERARVEIVLIELKSLKKPARSVNRELRSSYP